MQKNRYVFINRLKILLYFQIAALAFSLLGNIPGSTSLFQWLNRICDVGSLVCLFLLTAAGKRYLTTAILGSVHFVLSLWQAVFQFFIQLMLLQGIIGTEDITKYSEISAVLNLVSLVVGMVYTYQLYHAHGDMIQDLDTSLSRKWRRLFGWSFAVGILVTAAGMIFATVYTNLGLNSQIILSIFYTLIDIPSQIIHLVAVLYLHRTIQIMQSREEHTYG